MKGTLAIVGGLVLILACCPAQASVVSRPAVEGLSPHRERWGAGTIQEFPGHSAGWYWIYEGVAHAQTFRATGQELSGVRLRVARLNARPLAAPLEVEVRDLNLREVHLEGRIRPEQANRAFAWVDVEVSSRV